MLSTKRLLAVADGNAIPLEAVPDEVFASGMLGRGYALEPVSGVIYSPVSGRIDSIAQTRHAYGIRSDDGLDVLVHIGIDTVSLDGEGFISLVEVGDDVRAGDVIAKVDLALLRARGLSAVTPVVVSGADGLRGFETHLGSVRGGHSAVVTYKKQRSEGRESGKA